MGRTSRAYILGSFAAVVMLFGVAGQAHAVDVVAESACCNFTAGPFSQAQGETSKFVNPADSSAFHNLTSTSAGPDGNALFESETITRGTTSAVNGTQYLAAGSYPFVCTLHPGMAGDLIVEATGTPVARPGLKLSVLNQKLRQVRKSGKVKIKATALSATSEATIDVKRGKKVLAKISAPKLAAGASRTIAVKLSKAGRKAMKNGKKVNVSISALIPFGKAAKANRILR